MTSAESDDDVDLQAQLLRRVLQVAETHGAEHHTSNQETRRTVRLRHWSHQIDYRAVHVILWESGDLEVRITGHSSGPENTGVAYRVHRSTVNEWEKDVKFNPELARLALTAIDKFMVLDDIAGA
jgi:hypothetical protein